MTRMGNTTRAVQAPSPKRKRMKTMSSPCGPHQPFAQSQLTSTNPTHQRCPHLLVPTSHPLSNHIFATDFGRHYPVLAATTPTSPLRPLRPRRSRLRKCEVGGAETGLGTTSQK